MGDDLARDMTPEQRAERARKAWDAYNEEHGDEICDLIADLAHLADTEGRDTGADVLSRGTFHYESELGDDDES